MLIAQSGPPKLPDSMQALLLINTGTSGWWLATFQTQDNREKGSDESAMDISRRPFTKAVTEAQSQKCHSEEGLQGKSQV